MSAAPPDGSRSRVPAKLQDQLWYDTADAVRAGLRPGDLVLAHDDFRRALPNVVSYEARRHLLSARIDHYVLHKGLLAELDPEFLADALQLTPRFANEVFVVLSRAGGTLPEDQQRHLPSLYEAARPLLDASAAGGASPSPVVARRSHAAPPREAAIHLVASLPFLEGGTEQHAIGLYELLAPHADVTVWSVCPSNRATSRRLPVQQLDERDGRFPQGGTVVLVGTYWPIGQWIERAQADRVVLVHTTDEPDRLARRLQELAAHGVRADLSVVSGGLLSRSGAYGSVGLPPVDLARFRPMEAPVGRGFVVGRMSRDDPSKHHPDDEHVYRRLIEAGCVVRIMGGTSVSPLGPLQVLPEGAVDAADFLRGLSCFYYRTGFRLDGARLYEGGGLVVAEALACGIPVVAERFGGYVDWIEHGRSGFLFDAPDEAVEHIVRLASDPALERGMRAAARARAEVLFGAHEMQRLLAFFGVSGP